MYYFNLSLNLFSKTINLHVFIINYSFNYSFSYSFSYSFDFQKFIINLLLRYFFSNFIVNFIILTKNCYFFHLNNYYFLNFNK